MATLPPPPPPPPPPPLLGDLTGGLGGEDERRGGMEVEGREERGGEGRGKLTKSIGKLTKIIY